MANRIVQPLQGNFFVELSQTDPAQGPATPLFTDNQAVYLSGEGDEALNTWKTWSHVFQAYDPSIIRSLSAYLNNNVNGGFVWSRIAVRSPGATIATPWERQILISAVPQPSRSPAAPTGALFKLTLADPLYRMAQEVRVAAWRGRISADVSNLATLAGFNTLAVEPTDRDLSLIQPYQSDFDFIIQRLLPLATNQAGSSLYILYVRGGVFHFHTVNFQLDGLVELNYQVEANGLTNLRQVNQTHARELSAAGGVDLTATDPLQGVTPLFSSQPSREIALANTLPSKETRQTILRHVGQNQVTAHVAEAQHQYAAAHVGLYQVELDAASYPFIGVGDIAYLRLVEGTGEPWEGTYLVSGVRHLLDRQTITTRMTLSRGEYGAKPGNNQGKLLSPAEVSASTITSPTSGDFSVTGGRQVVTVQSPG